ncbi:uncharacterized protein LOC141632548 [Silene latifolia]|uniref:uncharacterized protein LOC141632548 n=1 Tax=Silene latifolia TaxID=37657 RepID=UPI003D775F58
MRLNPQKCAFGVTSGKLLGHIISHHGNKVDPSKIKSIMEMPHPETQKEIRCILGRVQYISRFVAKLTMIYEPIFKKLKVGEHVMWDDQCQDVFDKIKEVLSSPPVLSALVAWLPLSLYLTITDTAMGAMLAQTVGKDERAIYYISKNYLDYEVKYTPLEKTCLALVWARKKLRHYMLSYSGRAVADFLADYPIEETEVVDTWSFPDEDVVHIENVIWDLYFDGASNYMIYGVGILLISPTGENVPVSIKLDFNVTNNAAVYKASLLGLRSALDLGVNNLLHMTPSMLYTMMSPWHFQPGESTSLEKVNPSGTGGHCFILVAIDYFTKWVEAKSYKVLKAKQVAQFIQNDIIFRDWPEKIPFALWGYRTSIRTTTGATSYYLVYGMEAVQPVELEVLSLRILLESLVPEADWVQEIYDSLVMLDEQRLNALYHVQLYQKRIERAFNKKVKPRGISEGNLVLKSF